MDFLKAERVGTSKWRVLAIPFGGPFKGKDFDGEYFSPRTDVKSQWFKERPVLFHHGEDEVIEDDAIGTQGELKKETDGWWGDVWLDRSNRYWTLVDSLLRAGKMYGSSGALGHMVRKDHETGEILKWPHIEQTLTPTPANPFARVVPAKASAHFKTAGIELDAALADMLADFDDLRSDLRGDLPSGGGFPAAKTVDEFLAALAEARDAI